MEEPLIETDDPPDTSSDDVPTIMSVETVQSEETISLPDTEGETISLPDTEEKTEVEQSEPMVILKVDEDISGDSDSAVDYRGFLDTDSEEEDD